MRQPLLILLLVFCSTVLYSQRNIRISIDATKPLARIAPSLHGVFFEEISHGGEGGLYAELIQNRGFEDARLPLATILRDSTLIPHRTPHFSIPNNGISDWTMPWQLESPWPAWSLETEKNVDIRLRLSTEKPLNSATPHSLEIDLRSIASTGRNDLVNAGFWGMNIEKGAAYQLNFYAYTKGYDGPVVAMLQSPDGRILASHQISSIAGSEWKKYSARLVASVGHPYARFVLRFAHRGLVYLDFVSLFPVKTFKNRPNGLRADLAQYLADLKPAFIRWPGGCFVEGINIENAPSWRRSIGPVELRPGTYSPWGYWSSDGFGYHEYLQFCEDIGADALYVFNAGVSCDFRSGTYIPDVGVDSIITDLLEGIEYAIGPVSSRWGKVRAANGHPAPFPLKYVEVGNEQYGPSYARRYNRFYEAIKKNYPSIKIVASMGIGNVNQYTLDSMRKVDFADEHAYKPGYWAMRNWDHFDGYKRGNWDLYVGEYATNGGVGKGNMLAALSDAVYMMSMERNGDLVKMSSYAPLLVNVNDVDWPVNLINFNSSKSFGRISYHAIRLFNLNRPDLNLQTQIQVSPLKTPKPLFVGGIGLATWDTKAEYKDIEITENGKIVYKSDFNNRAEEWKPVEGEWVVKEGALAQTAMGAQRFAWLKGREFSGYTLTLKARRTSDLTNAFIIPFAVKNDRTMLRAHIGSYVNKNCVFEMVSNGFEVADLSPQKRLSAPIETNRWYDIRLEVGFDSVKCYLDNQLLMVYAEPDKIFSIAGREEATGDIIVKMVNATGEEGNTFLEIKGVRTDGSARLMSLSAPSPEAENSLEHPHAYIPKESIVKGKGQGYSLKLKPWSISVLRLKCR